MEETNNHKHLSPVFALIAAVLIISGFTGIVIGLGRLWAVYTDWSLQEIDLSHVTRSIARLLLTFSDITQLLLAIPSFTAGVALLRHVAWARRLAVWVTIVGLSLNYSITN